MTVFLAAIGGRVIDSGIDLAGLMARARDAAHPQNPQAGTGTSPIWVEGPSVDGMAAWWTLVHPAGTDLTVFRTGAASAGIRFTLQVCRSPEDACARGECFLLPHSTSSELSNVSQTTRFRHAQVHVTVEDDFAQEVNDLVQRATDAVAPFLNSTGRPYPDAGGSYDDARRRSAAEALELLRRRYPAAGVQKTERPAEVRAGIDTSEAPARLHLTAQEWETGGVTAVCLRPLDEQRPLPGNGGSAPELPECGPCFGHAPPSGPILGTSAELDALNAFWAAHQSPPEPRA